jgi:hypothetical protein
MRMAWMLAVLLMATTAGAEDVEGEALAAPPRRNVVSIDLLNLTSKTLSVSDERVLSERLSVGLGADVTFLATQSRFVSIGGVDSFTPGFHTRTVGFEVTPRARYFLLGRAPVGLWVGPQLGVGLINERSFFEDSGPRFMVRRSFLTLSGAALAGCSVALGPHVILQAAAGLGGRLSRIRETAPADATHEVMVPQVRDSWEVRPVTQLALGYAF